MKKQLRRYKGFMHMRCPHCGEIRTFCTKNGITHYHCSKCNCNTVLEGNARTLWVNCPCGVNARYTTNMTEKMFDMECPECRNPVAVEWNSKKHIYQPIKE